jgi:hypothetical protein
MSATVPDADVLQDDYENNRTLYQRPIVLCILLLARVRVAAGCWRA